MRNPEDQARISSRLANEVIDVIHCYSKVAVKHAGGPSKPTTYEEGKKGSSLGSVVVRYNSA